LYLTTPQRCDGLLSGGFMLNKFSASRASQALPGTAARTWAIALCVPLSFAASVAMAQNAAPAAVASTGAGLQCILAGRVDGDQRWAPQARGVELLDAQGRRVTSADKAALASVKQARISSPALLSACNGDQALAKGDDLPLAKKTSSPAVSAGAAPVIVEAVGFPPLRVGGALVELRLSLAPERVVTLTR
jgi:hypothetical protein